MAHKTGNAVRNPVDGPYNTHFQGGMWRIFKGDAQANLPSGRTLEEALATCDEWNLKAAMKDIKIIGLKVSNPSGLFVYDVAVMFCGRQTSVEVRADTMTEAAQQVAKAGYELIPA